MALLPYVTFVLNGDTLMGVPGTYALPSPDDFVWLGEGGGAAVEYKVEKVSHYITRDTMINATTGRETESVNAKIVITVSVVP